MSPLRVALVMLASAPLAKEESVTPTLAAVVSLGYRTGEPLAEDMYVT